MTDVEVVESFDNAWRALAKLYLDSPDEVLRNSMNLLAKMIGEVRSKVNSSHEEKQMTIEEWIEMLNKSIEEDW